MSTFVVLKATTHRVGLPMISTPSIAFRSLAAFLTASETRMAFYLNWFLPIWVRQYQAPAEAKPDLEPTKEGVP